MSLLALPLAPCPTSAHDTISDNLPTMLDLINKLTIQQEAMMQQQQENAKRQIQLLESIANKEPPPPPMSTSQRGNGWTSTLSRIAMKNIIQPDVDQWKETLDPLLIFIGLFSAIVTAFLVPALAGLSQDPAERTNELLSNLTEIVIQLNGAEPSSLDLSVSNPFKPDSGAIHQIVFWSLSLLTSISVASLSIIQRTFPASMNRAYRYDNKLIVMLVRWTHSAHLLKPIVDALPQILILAVLLFVAGFLNTVFASAFALSPVPKPVFAASVISSVVVGFCGATIIYTIFFGLAPTRFTFPRLDAVPKLYRLARRAASLESFKWVSWYLSTSFDQPSEPTTSMMLAACRMMLLSTTDQNDADKIAQALWGIARYSLNEGNHSSSLPHSLEEGSHSSRSPHSLEEGRHPSRSPHSLEGGHSSALPHSLDKGDQLSLWPHAESFIDILVALLLPERGSRANLTCALATSKIYGHLNGMKRNKITAQDLLLQSKPLIKALHDTLARYASEMSEHSEAPKQLWTSAYMHALANIMVPGSSEEDCRDAPCLLLLFAKPVPELEEELFHIKNLAANSLYHTLHEDGQTLESPSGDLAISMLFGPFGNLQSHPIFSSFHNMTALIDFWHANHSVTNMSQSQGIDTVVQELFQFFCRRGLRVFVEAALEQAYNQREDNISLVIALLRSVALFRLREIDTNTSSYSDIVSGVISLTENTIFASAAMPSELRDGIIKVIRNMAARIKEKSNWAQEIMTWVKDPIAGWPSANEAVTRKTEVKGLVSAKWAKYIFDNVPAAEAILVDVDKATKIFADAKTRLDQVTVPNSDAQRGHLPGGVHTVNEEAKGAILMACEHALELVSEV